MNDTYGQFITFEGVEGAGKTTQIHLCRQWLYDLGVPAVFTREPGATLLGAELRQILLRDDPTDPIITEGIDPIAELLIYAADRAQHMQRVIKPALIAGKYVLCDRHSHSTIAYQGFGRKINLEHVMRMSAITSENYTWVPSLSIWLDIDPQIGLSRKKEPLDRIEKEDAEFHQRVRQGFEFAMSRSPAYSVRVDASEDIATVQESIRRIIKSRFALPGETEKTKNE